MSVVVIHDWAYKSVGQKLPKRMMGFWYIFPSFIFGVLVLIYCNMINEIYFYFMNYSSVIYQTISHRIIVKIFFLGYQKNKYAFKYIYIF